MPLPDNIPSLAKLALKYGTLDRSQYQEFSALKLKKRINEMEGEAALLIRMRLATKYQVGLLKLIQEYHILRKNGEAFGKIAVEKGFAREKDIQKALEIQKMEFRTARLKRLIGDILVESKVITPEQKLLVLKEQRLIAKKTQVILGEVGDRPGEQEPDLTEYEKEFLRIKALDEDFSSAVMEKGYASSGEVEQARQIQEKEFETRQSIKILGDIMVGLNAITLEQRDEILKALGREGPSPDPLAICSLEIRPDQMTAWLRVPKEVEQKVSLIHVKQLIETKGICLGIYPDRIIQGFLFHGSRHFPVAGIDNSSQRLENAKLWLDTDLNDSNEKRRGEVLATQHTDREPGTGKNLFGQSHSDPGAADLAFGCGVGARFSKDGTGIVAARTGRPSLSFDRLLYVHPILNILEDADLRYGPIEPYADIRVAGVITGAYPITAGQVAAEEIRGAKIEALGDVRSEVGITDALIRTQGDVHARYIHGCRMEIFGNLYVENEIFDSQIRCSGKIDSPNCRVVSSSLSAKKGVVLAGTGSKKNLPCLVTAGSEAHLVAEVEAILAEIAQIKGVLEDLKARAAESEQLAKKTFDRMVELKIFHDRARKTKETLGQEFKTKRETYSKKKQANILSLISNFDERMARSIASLKDLNQIKKDHDNARQVIEEQILKITPRTASKIKDLDKRICAYLEWSRAREPEPTIVIHGLAHKGSILAGAFCQVDLESDRKGAKVRERLSTEGKWEMVFT